MNNKLKNITFYLFFILILINLVNPVVYALDDSDKNKCLDCNLCVRYIVKFKEMSILEYLTQIKEKINDKISALSIEKSPFILTKLNNFRNKLKFIHLRAKLEIANLNENGKENIIFSNEYFNIFNGIVIQNINQDDIKKIISLSYVESIIPDFKIKADLHESVPLINATEVWKLHDMKANNITGEGVKIAILDTGINYNLPELGGGFGPDFTVIDGYDFVECEDIDGDICHDIRLQDDDPMDDNGHGTLCASITLGVAPDVKLYAYKTLNKMGEGWWSWTQDAMEHCLDPNNDGDFSDHVDVISLSVGCYLKELNPDHPLCIEIDNVVKNGIVVVAAAGNDGSVAHINFPGLCRESICVGASTKNDRMAGFSSRGPVKWDNNILIKPDVVAPGSNIKCLNRYGNYVYVDGTSFSTPHVAGASALLLQAHPDWSPNDSSHKIKDALKKTAVKIVNKTGVEYNETTQGAGRIDVLAAINLSDAPPIAHIYISGKQSKGLININGTAKNGIGLSEGFKNYTLSYKSQNSNQWVELKNSIFEVKNELIYAWNVSQTPDGIYNLKLFVKSKDQASLDIKTIWFGDIPHINIQIPDNVSEKDLFNIILKDENNDLVKSIVLFLTPWHLPQIKYGDNLSFNAPIILNPFIESFEGRILVINFQEKVILIKKIIILNN